jgi:hypothetical protein
VSFLFGADEPNFTEQQKIDFMQHTKVINGKRAKRGTSNAWDLTLSDGTVTHLASFQPIHESKPIMQFAEIAFELKPKPVQEKPIHEILQEQIHLGVGGGAARGGGHGGGGGGSR